MLYSETRDHGLFTKKKFFVWMLLSLLQSAMIYFLINFMYSTLLFGDGLTQDLWATSICAYWVIVLVHYLFILTFTRNFTLWICGMYLVSFLLFCPAFILAYNFFPDTELTRRLSEIAFSNWQFWACLFVIVALCFLPVFATLKFKQLLVPRMRDLLPSVDMIKVRKDYQQEAQRQACELIKRHQTQQKGVIPAKETTVRKGIMAVPDDGIQIKLTLADRVKAEQERVRREAASRTLVGEEDMIEEERKSIY